MKFAKYYPSLMILAVQAAAARLADQEPEGSWEVSKCECQQFKAPFGCPRCDGTKHRGILKDDRREAVIEAAYKEVNPYGE